MSQLPSKELLRSRRLSNGARGRPESILKWGSALAVLLVGAAPIVMASQIDNKSAVAHLFTTNGTAKLAHQLKSEKELISEYNFRTQNAKAFWAGKARAGKPVTFSAKSMSITMAPDGVVSLKRDGKVISGHDTAGWRIYKWTTERREGRKRIPGETTKLDNMAQVAPNEFMLWSSKRPFLVNVAIKQKDRYFTFELLHVSNDPKTGGLNNDWPGHRVEFDMRIDRQDDGWLLNTLLLNPYSELNTRAPHKPEPGIGFKWPYPQWSQTDDRPQPQGMVGVFAFTSDEEYDDILTDIWVAEPSLPRPNRANLKSWTKADVNAWLDNWIKNLGKPWRMFSFSPHNDYESLFRIADIAHKGGINRIKLHNADWQGNSPGSFNKKLFNNGAEDARKWAEYCNERGIDVHLHGFGQMIQYDDPKYGRFVLHDGLARSAQGTLLTDVSMDETVLLVKPDLKFWPGMKPGILPHYRLPPWGSSNGGYGTAFPPYYESNASNLKIGKCLYDYTVKLAPDNMWEVKLGRRRVGPKDATHKAGDLVEFMVMGSGGWFAPDSRSVMFEQTAKEYATVLNQIKGNPHYDGSGWTGDIGSWGLRKFSQMVYEHLDHPVDTGTGSSFGLHLLGDFEHQFKKIQKLQGRARGGVMPVTTWNLAVRASSLDHSIHGINMGVRSKDMAVRGNHKGISIDLPEKHGGWDEAMKTFHLWSEMKPHISLETRKMIASNSMMNLFLATETEDQWQVTRARVMRREGIDAGWQRIPERPQTAPRQALKANGEVLRGLNNPYVSQVPEVQLHVQAGMSTRNKGNTSLMPKKESDVINPDGAIQDTAFKGGTFTISYDNTNSKKDSKYNYRGGRGEKNMHWLPASIGHPKNLDMSKARGVSLTVVGDGSGAILIFAAGTGFPRAYGVIIDFVGKRTFEIPTGEYINSRAYWDVHHGAVITASSYAFNQFCLYLYSVPAGKRAKVEVLDLQAMTEDQDTGMIDPVLNLNGATVTVHGTIPYSHYLVYSEGSKAKIYGQNWHFVKDLPITVTGKWEAMNGNNTFSVNAPKSPDTWISCRIKVRDTENVIKIEKPKQK